MSRLEESIGSLPETLEEIARAVGPVPAVQVARKLGGSRIYLSRTLYSAHPLAGVVGLAAANLIRDTLGRDYWIVPTATTFLNWADARVLRKCGFSVPQIAARTGVTTRHAYKLLSDFVPEDLELTPLAMDIARTYGVRSRLSGAEVPQSALSLPPSQSQPAERRDGQLDMGFLLASCGMRLTDV